MAGSATTQPRSQHHLQQRQYQQHTHNPNQLHNPHQHSNSSENVNTDETTVTNATVTTTFIQANSSDTITHHEHPTQGGYSNSITDTVAAQHHQQRYQHTTMMTHGGRAINGNNQQQHPPPLASNVIISSHAYGPTYQTYQLRPIVTHQHRPQINQQQQHVVNICMDDDQQHQLRVDDCDDMVTYDINIDNRMTTTATALSRRNGNTDAVTIPSRANHANANIAAENTKQQQHRDILEVSVLDELYAVVASSGGDKHNPSQHHSQKMSHHRANDDADHVLKSLDEGNEDDAAAVDGNGEPRRVRHRHRRPLYRRLISYMRSAWTAGVNFSSSNGTGKRYTHKKNYKFQH